MCMQLFSMGKAVCHREERLIHSDPSPALRGLLAPFGEVKPGAETSPRKATVLQTLGVYRALPDSEARSTASRKSWASPLVAWSWAMKTRSDLGTPRKEIPEETAWETEAESLGTARKRHGGPTAPGSPGAARDHQAGGMRRRDSGVHSCILAGTNDNILK